MQSEVYYNLRKKLFSVRIKGKVKHHNDNVVIYNPRFVVQEGGRQRVLKTKQKNVHAFVRGSWVGNVGLDFEHNLERAYYNPYKCNSFIDYVTQEKVSEAEYAWLTTDSGKPIIWYKTHDNTFYKEGTYNA
tara:strand:+ start:1308 stop:1700 length:393 start_codon:yes stop_codon:yes gene_type:complete